MSTNRKVDKMKMGRWQTADNFFLSEEKDKRKVEVTPVKKSVRIQSE